jgi:hypothetical protein
MAPALPQNHFTGVTPDGEFEAFRPPHGPQLHAH